MQFQMQEQILNFLRDKLIWLEELARDITYECLMISELYFVKNVNHLSPQELIQELDWVERQSSRSGLLATFVGILIAK
jgi:hypothetical protein